MKIFTMFLSFLLALLCIRLICFVVFQPILFDGQPLSFTTTLLSDPTQKGNLATISVVYQNVWGGKKIVITIPVAAQLQYGQTVRISGVVKNRVLGKSQTVATVYLPHIEAVITPQDGILTLANTIRQKTAKQYSNALYPTDAGLLLGIVLGMKANFSRIFTQDLQATGVLHVIAASGMNVSMVAGVLSALAVKFFRRQIALFLCIGGVLFYMILSGLQASILRAGIMAICAFSAQLFGRQYYGLYGLFLAGWGMLMYQPSLILDVGFQLSVGATLGIMLIKPLLPKISGTEDLSTTISAQLMTLPILLSNFGMYGLFSVFVNFLVLWTIPPLMILGALGALIGFVLPQVGNIFLYLCVPLLWFFETVVRYFGSLGLTVQIQTVPIAMIVGYYVLVCAGILYVENK